MAQTLSHITLLVRDYDEAVAFFTNALGFQLIEDTPQDEGKRWVLVAPAGSHGTSLLLAQASTPEQTARIGDPDRRARLSLPAHRRFRARLS